MNNTLMSGSGQMNRKLLVFIKQGQVPAWQEGKNIFSYLGTKENYIKESKS